MMEPRYKFRSSVSWLVMFPRLQSYILSTGNALIGICFLKIRRIRDHAVKGIKGNKGVINGFSGLSAFINFLRSQIEKENLVTMKTILLL